MMHGSGNILVDLPRPERRNPVAAAAVQELLGGEFGVMTTSTTYQFQLFNLRKGKEHQPFHDLIDSIACEEALHLEAIAAAINLLLAGGGSELPSAGMPAPGLPGAVAPERFAYHYFSSAQAASPSDSLGKPWCGANVAATGDLKLDLLHDFFLECGSRSSEIRAYETTPDPMARALIGYLLVRTGVHIVAFAKALEKLTGADVRRLLPIPSISNQKFPEAMKLEQEGLRDDTSRWQRDKRSYSKSDSRAGPPLPRRRQIQSELDRR